MKLSFYSLPLALSLLGIAQAVILEEYGYEIETEDSTHSVYSYYYGESSRTLTKIGFYPDGKTVAIQIAKNDEESDHEDKLSLSEIFAALCEKEDAKPDDIIWLVFDVYKDPNTNNLIREIRNNHNSGLDDDVRIRPASDEWMAIAKTQYYKQAMDLINRPPQEILLGHYFQEDILKNEIPTDCIYFNLPKKG
ncbi:hypothetical protein Cpir12675_000583 [Ceratocystis pirilliformis]|uniref:Uncharacterized protein n=1 Tax=Ceratocystis pirilliformis TaxID=259994 RepID=A0ABR3ZM31_9PEZI